MSLQIALSEITLRLRQGRFPNEQAISQGIVLRVLQELGWDSWDTSITWPEYQTGEGRADFALCHPPLKPAIFIEVKQPGKADNAVRQALEYAFHTGVPFVVLTDGKTWSFYLPAEQGTYDDRRVHKLDLFERSSAEAAAVMERYLSRARVETGQALETARSEYRSRNRRAQAKAAIAEAWQELVQKGDELLVELLTNAVESKAGVQPDPDDVTEFLASLTAHPPTFHSPNSLAPASVHRTDAPYCPPASSSSHPKDPQVGRRGTLTIKGKSFPFNNAKDAMVIVLSQLANDDPTFLERCAQHPDAQGRKRRYLARNIQDLYPDRPDLAEMSDPLPGGWHVATNLNNILKKAIIQLATEVAGLHFGSDVTIPF